MRRQSSRRARRLLHCLFKRGDERSRVERRLLAAKQLLGGAPSAERAHAALAVLVREVGQCVGASSAQAPLDCVDTLAMLVERRHKLVNALRW
jgi:hypothetical protein